MIERKKHMLWTNEISRDLSLRWISGGYSILHSTSGIRGMDFGRPNACIRNLNTIKPKLSVTIEFSLRLMFWKIKQHIYSINEKTCIEAGWQIHTSVNQPSLVQITALRLVFNAGILSIRTLRTNFSEILNVIHTFNSRKCIWICRLRNGGTLFRPQCVNWLNDGLVYETSYLHKNSRIFMDVPRSIYVHACLVGPYNPPAYNYTENIFALLLRKMSLQYFSSTLTSHKYGFHLTNDFFLSTYKLECVIIWTLVVWSLPNSPLIALVTFSMKLYLLDIKLHNKQWGNIKYTWLQCNWSQKTLNFILETNLEFWKSDDKKCISSV